jgi:hypothetical protein
LAGGSLEYFYQQQKKEPNMSISYKSCHGPSEAKGERNDCTVKAVAISCDIPYKQAHALMDKQGRKPKQGAFSYQYLAAIEEAGLEAVQLPLEGFGRTPITFVRTCDPSKSYIVRVSGHLFAVKKGKVEDWTEGRRNRIQNVWEVRPILSKNARRKAARYGK